MYERILTDVGCLATKDDLECLRSQNASKLNQALAHASSSYVPILNADLVTGYTSVALHEGNYVAGSWEGISSTTIDGIVDKNVNKMLEEELEKSLSTIRQSPGP
ncbi:unnamed protein product [Alternaria sp. RS040]